jgi:hypothetical protein
VRCDRFAESPRVTSDDGCCDFVSQRSGSANGL